MKTRRDFITIAAASVAGTMVAAGWASPGRRKATPQRVVVMMFDGFGPEYFDRSSMPTLRRWQRDGFYKQVEGVMPSVTNANNASICCGAFPRDHGITGNSYLDTSTNREEYMGSHGSSHELAIPLFAYNAKGLPEERYFKHNLDLARRLYR